MRHPALAFAVLLGLVLPAAASASSVRVNRGAAPQSGVRSVLGIRALGGERNKVGVRAIAGRRVIVSDRVALSPGPGCRALSTRRALCRLGRRRGAPNFYLVRVSLGDRNDRIRFRGAPGGSYTSTRLVGGAGNDALGGARAETNRFDGGAGDDRMAGSNGQDIFREGSTDSGSDIIGGGRGVSDVVDYSRRTAVVRADLAGDRDDGEAGEGDRIGVSVDGANGGSGNDTLTGNPLPNAFEGNGGNDSVNGDRGIDRVDGGPGDDTLGLNDAGFVDELFCGRGADTAFLDVNDYFANLGGDRCETVTRAGPAGPIYFGIGRERLRGGKAAVSIACPGDAPAPLCGQSARLETAGRVGPETLFARRRNDVGPVGVSADSTTAGLVAQGQAVQSELVLVYVVNGSRQLKRYQLTLRP